jgi:hypothetical protein
MDQHKTWNRKRIAKVAILAIMGILGLFVLYLVLLCHPGLFFRHAFTHDGITLYSDEPIPASARQVIEDTEKRLVRSPFFRDRPPGDIRIYLCNRKWRFILFANHRYRVGGLTYPPLTNNIFLRGAHIEANRLIGPSGNEVPGERTLGYYCAHEATHTLVSDELGVARFWRLPTWKNDGYADYVGKGTDFDYERAVDQLRSGAREMNPKSSGLYLHYHLLVAYLLDKKGISVREMLDQAFDPAELEREILE